MSPSDSFSEKMRQNRLVFYAEDVGAIDAVLEKFLEASHAKCVLMVDLEGHMVTKKGFTSSLDTTSIAALVAGSFASTREVARKLGEQEFSVLFHQGTNENIHISLVADRALAVIIFDDRTTIGMVRLYAKEVADNLAKILDSIKVRLASGKPGGPEIGADFTQAAEKQIDSFFDETK